MKSKIQGMAGILFSLGSCALVPNAHAGPSTFTDNSRDLILTFRTVGQYNATASSVVLEVDLGQASIYYGAAANTTIPITAYDKNAQLANLFGGAGTAVENLGWSICGCVPPAGDSGSPSKPTRTLWVTAPRLDPSTPATPWQRESSFTQGQAAQKVYGILNNALYWSTVNPGDSVTNTSTALAIPAGNGDNSFGDLGPLGNLEGTFQGDIENITDGGFDLEGNPSISDLYELQPGSGNGTYLGYFSLGTDGSLTFTAGSQTVITYPAPTLSVKSDGNGNALVSFQSTANGTYTLHYTGAAGLTTPVTSWSTVSTNIIGNGSVQTFTEPAGTGATFYTVSVH